MQVIKNEIKPTQQEEFFDSLKENYVKRIEEVDAFSRRLSNAYTDVNTEFLYGCINTVQHFLDLQKKYSNQYPGWYFTDFMANITKKNTEAWIQAVHNIDSISIEGMKNMKNNLRAINKNSILAIQSVERGHDIYENIQSNHKNQTKLQPQKRQAELEPIQKKANQT